MGSQPFIEKYVRYESGIVLPGSLMKGKDDSAFVLEYNGIEVRVFKDTEDSFKFVDGYLKKMIASNRGKIAHIISSLIGRKWNDYFDWECAMKFLNHGADDHRIVPRWFKDKFDSKKHLCGYIYDNITSVVRELCGNDEEKISRKFFMCFNVNDIVDDIEEVQKFVPFQHGSYFYVPMIPAVVDAKNGTFRDGERK